MANYTINDLVNSGSLSGLRLVAGEDKIDNEIGNVNTIDNPDSFDWLKAGDFVLTTGYLYKDNPDELVRLVERLAKINCAGIGFKILRFFDKIPQAMLKKAAQLGVPIVEIPLKYSLSDVSNEINNSLRVREETQLTQYLRIHNSFNECSLTGGGAYGIISTLHSYVQNPVILMDSRWRMLSSIDPDNTLGEIDLRPQKIIFPQRFLDTLPPKITGKTKIITRTYPDENGSLIARIAILEDEKSIYGYIVVFETKQQMDYLDFVALESATIPLVLDRVKAKQLNEVKHQLRQDFFDDLLQGKIESVNAVSSLAEIHHMDTKNTYLCMVVKFQNNDSIMGEGEEQRNNYLHFKQNVITQIDQLAPKHKMEVVSIHRSNLIICFVLVPDRQTSMRVRDFLGEFPTEVSEQIKAMSEIKFTIGVGIPIDDYLNIRKSYIQANGAMRYITCSENGCVCYYEDCMVDQLLDCVNDRQALESFGRLSLGKLCDYDSSHGTNLLETLEIYFECNGNVSIAAKKLFLHRNSLIYRIDKIKEILNSDLKNASELLTLQVGIRVLKILSAK